MTTNIFIPSIIDIEASGFGSSSYPIEIGVVMDDGERLCRLIQPHPSWTHWDDEAESLHGIPYELLVKSGQTIPEVCAAFNHLLAGKTVYSDGWSHDMRWLRRLYEFGGMECDFHLSPIESVASEEQLQCWAEAKAKILLQNRGIVRHRATNDAMLVQQTFCKSAELVQASRKSRAGPLKP